MTVSYPRRRVVRLSHQRLRQRHAVVGLVLHVVLEQVVEHHHHSFRQLPTNTTTHSHVHVCPYYYMCVYVLVPHILARLIRYFSVNIAILFIVIFAAAATVRTATILAK